MTKKKCRTCKKLLDLSKFCKLSRSKDGHHYDCKDCRRTKEEVRVAKSTPVSEKLCKTCDTVKPADEFHKNKGKRTGLCEQCKICRNISMVEKRHSLKKGELQELKIRQNLKCAICEQVEELAVDHCHTTGKVRGMLCNNCNNGIGRFKDNIDYLHNAINYLKEN